MDGTQHLRSREEMLHGTVSWSLERNRQAALSLFTSNSMASHVGYGNNVDPRTELPSSSPQYDSPHLQNLKQHANTSQVEIPRPQPPFSGQGRYLYTGQRDDAATFGSVPPYQHQLAPTPVIQRPFLSHFDHVGADSRPGTQLLSPHAFLHSTGSMDYSHQDPLPCNPMKAIRVGDQAAMLAYYESAFHALQQTNCRMIAKAFVKAVEPRKQAKYPYNGGKGPDGQKGDPESTKPSWWPDGVTHREPDHLKKPERVRLLIHILRGLGKSRGVTVDQLEDAGRSIRRRIKPVERLEILSEIYRVRRVEEQYENGKIDGSAEVYVVDRASKLYNDEEPRSSTSTPARFDTVQGSPPPGNRGIITPQQPQGNNEGVRPAIIPSQDPRVQTAQRPVYGPERSLYFNSDFCGRL
ncbi:hypothetical protein VTN00DRAFT_3509 [Thermoascus crustaceus]|uniref:uncharacterized protein n=1 Tax=Thermoascus crustaceus TaxID=5088 RepID=UPI003742012F